MNATQHRTQQLQPPVKPQIATVALEGEIGERELNEVVELLERTAARSAPRLVLDLGEVTHFDYRGVRPLVACAGRIREKGGEVKLANLSPYLSAIFRSAGAHDAFEYHPSVESAQAAFERRWAVVTR